MVADPAASQGRPAEIGKGDEAGSTAEAMEDHFDMITGGQHLVACLLLYLFEADGVII